MHIRMGIHAAREVVSQDNQVISGELETRWFERGGKYWGRFRARPGAGALWRARDREVVVALLSGARQGATCSWELPAPGGMNGGKVMKDPTVPL